METVLVLSALLLIVVHWCSILLAANRLKRPTRDNALQREKPPVSIVVPLRGVENFTSLTLSRAFQLEWPSYEIIFCVADSADPVIDQAKAQMAANPDISARILVGDDCVSANPKLNNCVKGWRSATHDWVILADSNVLMPGDYIVSLMGAWRDDSGLVCSPPIGSRAVDMWSAVECAFLNSFQARYQYVAEALGSGFAQGKTMLWNKPFLDQRGGIEALGAEIAEDAAATKLVRASGLHVHLVSTPFEQPLGSRRLNEIWSRQTRWARLRRVTFPSYFLPEIFVGAMPPLLLATVAIVVSELGAASALAAALGVLFMMYVPEILLAAFMGWSLSWRSLPAMMIRDLMLPAIWIKSFVGASVSWRGNVMTVGTEQSSLTNA
ncbi:glycosyltransferase [Agrobacterium larrymoorei]|uniref:ceramide glucosyltransferase n=1 Tax=Agrobacterium larrymoorei TaxID=160699 RepID=UPI0015720DAA|nr:ceramide glucosyltransferase [Agrobacterium larrymoorei]NTJ43935.1 glycosyltransferase [Agrobacterium larrymoorei]